VSGANSGAKDMPADDDLEKANGIIKSMCKGLLQDGIPSVICGRRFVVEWLPTVAARSRKTQRYRLAAKIHKEGRRHDA
jgi:hypothetical protein